MIPCCEAGSLNRIYHFSPIDDNEAVVPLAKLLAQKRYAVVQELLLDVIPQPIPCR